MNGSTSICVPRTASTSPVVVSLSFATAAMSPAGTSRDGVLLVAAHGRQLVQPLLGDGPSVQQRVVGLHGALQHLEQVDPPDVGVDQRLEHERGGRRFGRADVGRRSFFDDEAREPVDADQLVALPHRTGKTVASSMPWASASASSSVVDRLVGEVALHEIVVGDDDAFDQRVVHRVLAAARSSGTGPWVPAGDEPS